MSDVPAGRQLFSPSAVEILFGWFQRIIAVYCMLLGLFYWVRLIGYFDAPLWRLDLMPPHWQLATMALAVFFPFAAAGLWMLASWGPVIWFICAATETVMFFAFSGFFGSHYLIVASHIFAALLYLAFRVVIALQNRPQPEG